MSDFTTELARWLALDQYFQTTVRSSDSHVEAATMLVRELAADRARLLRRIDALEAAMNPQDVAAVDAALEREWAERLAEMG